MGRRFIPFSRLSIVFILAMVLSGGILTYFSINNISNLKELTEKRILEEERELYASFSLALRNNLEKVSTDFNQKMVQSDSMKEVFINAASNHGFITQVFILNTSGQFIFPNFSGIPQTVPGPMRSKRFRTAFDLGEEAEFAKEDLKAAKSYYLSCLKSSKADKDSVIALNALGRISVKMGQIEYATFCYSSIIQQYFPLSDNNGFPYAYYALFHLLNHSDKSNYEEIVPVLEFAFKKMAFGSIPLSYHSKEILDLATVWLKENLTNDDVTFSEFNTQISRIRQQIQFINHYGNDLPEFFRANHSEAPYTDSNGFKIVNMYSGNKRAFFLVNTDYKNTVGFLIDRDSLYQNVLSKSIQDDLDFEYLITFPSGFDSDTAPDKLSFSSQLTPYLPEQIVQIHMQNENLLTDLIQRRSWIYGIASILLLVTMLLGVILILRDIAREKHLANLRSDFVSNVTHELKTPLTSIRMYAESLRMSRVKSVSRQKKYLSVVINESERLKRMINNILEFSKMEKSRQEYHLIDSNLSEILHTAVLDMNYWLEKEGFNINTQIEADIKVKVDPEKFYQVYSNLLSNAIKYSGDSRNICIRLYRNNGSVITEIEDEGIGIAEAELTKIFEEFYRIKRHESGNITGTGLGLTVVKEIVEAHGGKIRVHSKIGKGSKFSVFLFQQ